MVQLCCFVCSSCPSSWNAPCQCLIWRLCCRDDQLLLAQRFVIDRAPLFNSKQGGHRSKRGCCYSRGGHCFKPGCCCK
ncbi:hypothetical protein DUNSADRAFT_2251 [Dunaliella salina]|uniref:Conotoxin n=1 Tax=Dunaliella salina TaxID=3046 RepID=A0ABQ7GVZ3_DUNSA|nr:hypothetical protein DUNSADRAFT_2251 [Dunaliella salina]|eukprot:KAF5838788.1 hypothetical protein DUNSADRAFT_2251 [Dunaliella salina]